MTQTENGPSPTSPSASKAPRLSIELDWVFDLAEEDDEAADRAKLDEDLAVTVAQFHLESAEVVDFHGPAGGWPLVRFTGHRDTVIELVRDYVEGDPVLVAEMMKLAVEL